VRTKTRRGNLPTARSMRGAREGINPLPANRSYLAEGVSTRMVCTLIPSYRSRVQARAAGGVGTQIEAAMLYAIGGSQFDSQPRGSTCGTNICGYDDLSLLSVGDDGGQSTGAGGVYMRFERKVSVEDNDAPIR